MRTRYSFLSVFFALLLALSAISIGSAQSADQVVASENDIFSVRLPPDWMSEDVAIPGFDDVLVFGSTQANMQGMIDSFINGDSMASFSGVSGMIGSVNPDNLQGVPPQSVQIGLMSSILANIEFPGVEIYSRGAQTTFGDGYEGLLSETNIGYIGVFSADDTVLILLALSDDVQGNFEALQSLMETVRIPAESAVPVTPEPTADVILDTTPEPTPTAEITESAIARSADGRVSLHLPTGWSLFDHSEANNILAYGDSGAAAQSRLFFANSALVPETPLTGNGGLIILYPMSSFGIDPEAPDLNPLMERALSGMSGYTVEQAATPLEGSEGGIYVIISGLEVGYLALIPFDDQIAYVTATGTSDSFEQMETELFAIIESIRMPAEEDVPLGGLGGLGGLLGEATPEATEQATGLGGL